MIKRLSEGYVGQKPRSNTQVKRDSPSTPHPPGLLLRPNRTSRFLILLTHPPISFPTAVENAPGPKIAIAFDTKSAWEVPSKICKLSNFLITACGQLQHLKGCGLKRGVTASWPPEDEAALQFADAPGSAFGDCEFNS